MMLVYNYGKQRNPLVLKFTDNISDLIYTRSLNNKKYSTFLVAKNENKPFEKGDTIRIVFGDLEIPGVIEKIDEETDKDISKVEFATWHEAVNFTDITTYIGSRSDDTPQIRPNDLPQGFVAENLSTNYSVSIKLNKVLKGDFTTDLDVLIRQQMRKDLLSENLTTDSNGLLINYVYENSNEIKTIDVRDQNISKNFKVISRVFEEYQENAIRLVFTFASGLVTTPFGGLPLYYTKNQIVTDADSLTLGDEIRKPVNFGKLQISEDTESSLTISQQQQEAVLSFFQNREYNNDITIEMDYKIFKTLNITLGRRVEVILDNETKFLSKFSEFEYNTKTGLIQAKFGFKQTLLSDKLRKE